LFLPHGENYHLFINNPPIPEEMLIFGGATERTPNDRQAWSG